MPLDALVANQISSARLLLFYNLLFLTHFSSWILSGASEVCTDPSCSAEEPHDIILRTDAGHGCQPFHGTDSSVDWLSGKNRNLNLTALRRGAQVFICYNGRQSSSLEGRHEDPSFADTSVLLVEDFLSDSEVRHMIPVVNKFVGPQPGYRFSKVAAGHYPSMPESWGIPHLLDDEVLNTIEERIGRLVSMPLSSSEMPLQLAITTPAVDAPRYKFHHDKNHAKARHVTALIYLTAADGGETLFPALPFSPAGPVPRTPLLRKVADHVQKLVREQSEGNFEMIVDDKRQRKMLAMCPGPDEKESCSNTSAACPLSVQPKAGRAIFFWHETVDGQAALTDIIHGGCPVRGGRKLALQKFKSYEASHPGCKQSRLCSS